MPLRKSLFSESIQISIRTLYIVLTKSANMSTFQDMSSYVAVQGTPRKDSSFVFGLTPKEVRYLRVIYYFLILRFCNKKYFWTVCCNIEDGTNNHNLNLKLLINKSKLKFDASEIPTFFKLRCTIRILISSCSKNFSG